MYNTLKTRTVQPTVYRGRFAPSPTGPLHHGSLYTAVASYLQARANKGRWHLRIDDLDPYRIVPGSTTRILETLEKYGLHWDGPILYQSRRLDAYQSALDQLERLNLVYACSCTRKSLILATPASHNHSIYPGYCREKETSRSDPHSLRLVTSELPIEFVDKCQGFTEQNIAKAVGDFIVRRRDQVFAYQLSVVVDDAEQQITEILRGIDLLDSTPRQIYLQKTLNLDTPEYRHIPVMVDREGAKLSKQSHAKPVDHLDASNVLFDLLTRLRQAPPKELYRAPTPEILSWAIAHWDPVKLMNMKRITL